MTGTLTKDGMKTGISITVPITDELIESLSTVGADAVLQDAIRQQIDEEVDRMASEAAAKWHFPYTE